MGLEEHCAGTLHVARCHRHWSGISPFHLRQLLEVEYASACIANVCWLATKIM